ncbi:MAG: hypothetical protein QM704_17870 [Anaeromyxobacteraceae bacterium]
MITSAVTPKTFARVPRPSTRIESSSSSSGRPSSRIRAAPPGSSTFATRVTRAPWR